MKRRLGLLVRESWEQCGLPLSVGREFRAPCGVEDEVLNDFPRVFGNVIKKSTTGRMVGGLSCHAIDMVIENLDLEPKVKAMVRDVLE
ncbi:hypothetical protein Tco_0828205 [Tanacetum coccineum]